jgi:predicted transcriptional regulator
VESHCLRQGLLAALHSGQKSMTQLKALVDFSDYQIYNALNALKRAGKVRTIRKAGRNHYALKK